MNKIKQFVNKNKKSIIFYGAMISGTIAFGALTISAYNKGYEDGKTREGSMWILKLIEAHQEGKISTEALNSIDPGKIKFTDF